MAAEKQMMQLDYDEPGMDTQSEFEPAEVATGEVLDIFARGYGVTRLCGEPDNSMRARLRDTLQIRRATEKVARGESLVPDVVLTAVELPKTSGADLIARMKADLAAKDEELLRLRTVIVEARHAVQSNHWALAGEILAASKKV